MSMSLTEAKERIRSKGLRATNARISVLRLFVDQGKPLSHGNVVELMKDNVGDQATLYRILVKFKEAGLIAITSTAKGISRYELIDGSQNETQKRHPHFLCNECGDISCLPTTTVILEKDNPWFPSLTLAEMQFVGRCINCD